MQASGGGPLVLSCAVTPPSLLLFAMEIVFLSSVCIDVTSWMTISILIVA